MLERTKELPRSPEGLWKEASDDPVQSDTLLVALAQQRASAKDEANKKAAEKPKKRKK